MHTVDYCYILKPSEPVEQWSGVRDATEQAPACVQFMAIDDVRQQSEDCLVLNVYTPTLEKNAKLPILFQQKCFMGASKLQFCL